MSTPPHATSPLQVCVFGAGAVGSILAARLARAGHAVSLVARAAHAQAIRQHGLRLVEAGGESVAQVTATDRPETLPRPDLTLVTLKAHSLPAAAPAIAALAAGGPVVFVVNGIPWWYFLHQRPEHGAALARLDPDGALQRAFAPEQVIGAVVRQPSALTAPGVVQSNGHSDSLLLGEPAGGRSERLQRLVQALQGASTQVAATDDIRAAIWDKLLTNLPTSLLCTLTLALPRDLVRNPATAALYRRIVAEGQAVAAAWQAALAIDVDAQMQRAGATAHAPSMLQDLQQGKPLEIDAQLLAVRDLARLAGVPMPTTDILLDLLAARIGRA